MKCPKCGVELKAKLMFAVPKELPKKSTESLGIANATPEITEQKEFLTAHDVQKEFTEEEAGELKIWDEPTGIKIKTKEYWRGANGKKKWQALNEFIKDTFGGKWISDGSNSHWLIHG